ncbi:MAG: hypothetical protein LLG45_08325 [Actinomycetia bacterium]|nr:hypothetical protein [Actinomycetes bacterium]
MTARHQVILFLIMMKNAAANQFVLTHRRKNLATLATLGLDLGDAKERVMGLTPEDYVEGPDPDDKRPGDEVWVFGLEIGGQEVYVKVCVLSEPLLCTCISFHLADRPLKYPLRARAR